MLAWWLSTVYTLPWVAVFGGWAAGGGDRSGQRPSAAEAGFIFYDFFGMAEAVPLPVRVQSKVKRGLAQPFVRPHCYGVRAAVESAKSKSSPCPSKERRDKGPPSQT